MGSFQTSITLRKARVINHEETMNNELSKQIISNMEKQMQEREDMEPGEMEKAISMVREVFKEAERALDLTFAAGVLASKVNGVENHTQDLLAPTKESVNYSASIPATRMMGDLKKARQ